MLGPNPEWHNPESHNLEGHNPERHYPEDPQPGRDITRKRFNPERTQPGKTQPERPTTWKRHNLEKKWIAEKCVVQSAMLCWTLCKIECKPLALLSLGLSWTINLDSTQTTTKSACNTKPYPLLRGELKPKFKVFQSWTLQTLGMLGINDQQTKSNFSAPLLAK